MRRTGKIPRKRFLPLLALAAALSWAATGGAAPTSASWTEAPVSKWQPEPASVLPYFIALNHRLAGSVNSTDSSAWVPVLTSVGSAAFAPPQAQPGSMPPPGQWEPVTDLTNARSAGEPKRTLATGNTWSGVSACQGAVTFPCPKTLVICAAGLSCNLSPSPSPGLPQNASARQDLKTALENWVSGAGGPGPQSGGWISFEGGPPAPTAQAPSSNSGPGPALIKAGEKISELSSSAAAEYSASSAAAEYSGGLSPN